MSKAIELHVELEDTCRQMGLKPVKLDESGNFYELIVESPEEHVVSKKGYLSAVNGILRYYSYLEKKENAYNDLPQEFTDEGNTILEIKVQPTCEKTKETFKLMGFKISKKYLPKEGLAQRVLREFDFTDEV